MDPKDAAEQMLACLEPSASVALAYATLALCERLDVIIATPMLGELVELEG